MLPDDDIVIASTITYGYDNMKRAVITIIGTAPMTQSQSIQHLPPISGEGPDAFDQRLWRSKAHVIDGIVHIKGFALQSAIIDGAKHGKEKIPGKGNSTWGKKFESAIMIDGDVSLGIREEDLIERPVYVNADGVRGSGKRVWRRFPEIQKGWTATATVFVLDDEITREVFERAVRRAGIFVGLGQFRPQNRGTNGRFSLTDLQWEEAAEEFAEAAE